MQLKSKLVAKLLLDEITLVDFKKKNDIFPPLMIKKMFFSYLNKIKTQVIQIVIINNIRTVFRGPTQVTWFLSQTKSILMTKLFWS